MSNNKSTNSIKDKRWELLNGVKKGLEELHSESQNEEIFNQHAEETQSEFDIKVGEDELKATNDEMFEYYKKHGNLNFYYYLEDNPEWRKAIDEMTLMFYEKLNQPKEKKVHVEEEVKVIEEINIVNQINKESSNLKKFRKTTELPAFRKISDNVILRHDKKPKINFEKTCLDFDDSTVKMEMPKDFVKDKHEDLMNSLAEDLMRSRRAAYLNNNSNFIIKNDDYNLLLCLMRNRKHDLFERNPYYINYHIELDDVYINEKDQAKDENEESEEKGDDLTGDIENFVKMFTDREYY